MVVGRALVIASGYSGTILSAGAESGARIVLNWQVSAGGGSALVHQGDMLRTALRTLGRTSVRSARLPSAAPAAVVVVSTRMYTDNHTAVEKRP